MQAKRILSATALVAAMAVLGAQNAQAQASSNITASAIVAAALQATTVQNLAFGTVIPGTPRTIATTDATNAGIVRFFGGVNAEVNVTLPTLPANLSDGTNNLPYTASAAYALTQAGAQTGFVPATGATTRLDGTTGFLYVFVAGQVSPAVGQVAGSYSGTITVQAAYTGN